MTEIEKVTTTIGELVSTEMDDVESIHYNAEKIEELTSFTIIMVNGKQYTVNIKEI